MPNLEKWGQLLKKQNKTDLVQYLSVCSNMYLLSISFKQALGLGWAGLKRLNIYWATVLLR